MLKVSRHRTFCIVMTYRVINTRNNPPVIISGEMTKVLSIEAALLMNRLDRENMLCIAMPSSRCKKFIADLTQAAQVAECVDFLRSTSTFSREDVTSLLDQCKEPCAPPAHV